MSKLMSFESRLRSARALCVAALFLIACPVLAQNPADPPASMWHYPSSTSAGAEQCRTPAAYSKDPDEVAVLHMKHNNAVTTMQCFQTCSNPYTHLGTTVVIPPSGEPTTAIARLRSNCTGGEYTYEIKRIPNPKPPSCPEDTAGNPCNLATGAKVQSAVDYRSPDGDLELTRYYHSYSPSLAPTLFGPNWQSNYDRKALGFSRPVAVSLIREMPAFFWRPEGNAITFRFDAPSGEWRTDADVSERLTQLATPEGLHDGWILETKGAGSREVYDAAGRLIRLEDTRGAYAWLTYGANGALSKVTDRKGRSIGFLASSGMATEAALPDGSKILYRYTSSRLSSAVYPDATAGTTSDNPTVTYLYEKSGQPQLLTGIVDENGNRSSSWDYDSQNRVTLSVHGGTASTVDRVSVSYGPDGSATLTQPLGAVTTVNFTTMHDVRRLSSQSGLCPSCNGEQVLQKTFDANGHPDIVTNLKGVQTDYDYSTAGLLTQRVDAANDASGAKRKTQTDWLTGLRVPLQRRMYDASSNLLRTEAWTYNARGQALTQSQTDGVSTRTTTSTYCEQADITAGFCPLLGLVRSVDGPRADLSDVVAYTYRPAEHPDCSSSPATCMYRKGDLWKITDALGQVTETLRYDGSGRILSAKDANGVVTDFEYHPRGWIAATKVRGANDSVETDDRISRIEYWPAGTVKRVVLPDGSSTSYVYDTAKRLTDIVDDAGNSIHYTLDDAGNRKREDTKTAGGTIKRTLSRVYNALGQLQAVKDASQNATSFSYDAGGNLDQTTDALGRITDQNLDPLNRLSRTLQDINGLAVETKFEYNAFDQTTKVVDPKGLGTSYSYNGFGDQIQLSSPDTGVTTYGYNAAGQVASKQDANDAQPHTYTYDALGRTKTVSYGSGSADVEYDYDTVNSVCTAGETFAIGRVTAMRTEGTELKYCYDRFGQVVRKVQSVDGQSFTLRYAYTLGGQLQAVTYPDGAVADYVRDSQGRVSAIGVTPADGVRNVLLSNATYEPFGPATGWTYGNGRSLVRTYDQDYRAKTILDSASGGLSLSYGYNEVGELTELKDGLESAFLAKYDYDTLGRLKITRDGPTGTPLESYGYDATGNRTSLLHAGITIDYTYPSTNHRLSNVGGVSRSYDSVGNTTSIGGAAKEFVYNANDRMSQVKQAGVVKASYHYNAKGERVSRADNAIGAITGYTLYDEAGHWLGDYDANGASKQQAVWLGDEPVGLMVGAGVAQTLRYLQPDHLGTPRAVIDPSRNLAVWTWDAKGEAFGNNPPNQDPDQDGTAFVFDMRFPGQRFDAATGLNYNYFRDYEGGTGRYAESDPMGLLAGTSTYSYVGSSPLQFTDSLGLDKDPECVAACTVVGSVVGGGVGYVGGGVGGAVGGGAACTLVAPGVGTVGCGGAGAVAGSSAGGVFGAGVGGVIGHYAGQAVCPDDDPCKGIRKQLEKHKQKLAKYIANPYAHDNLGKLGKGNDEAEIAWRIASLIKQIVQWERELAKCEAKHGR
ncbi:RHS repeat-associated core domain-containing protein [Lysobacter sp. CA196]|uniref:RHS repeat-associated core domain-containing protein n=1 Tax=Lysobacter sp. CA196 TaxID=3455606 RepID=UPI003F8D7F7F